MTIDVEYSIDEISKELTMMLRRGHPKYFALMDEFGCIEFGHIVLVVGQMWIDRPRLRLGQLEAPDDQGQCGRVRPRWVH